MPLAPAHPAVVLPLQRLGLPLSALVAGAVAPDSAVYLPVPVSYATTHSGGGLVVDAVLGLTLLLLWDRIVRDAVVDLVPLLRHRRPARVRIDRRGWVLAPLAVAVGAATHVLWDSVTHDWGFVVASVDVLRTTYGALPAYGWLQHLSTLVGGLVVAGYCVSRLRRYPVAPRPSAVPGPRAFVVVVLVSGPAALVVTREANAVVGAVLVAVLVVALAWQLVRHRVGG